MEKNNEEEIKEVKIEEEYKDPFEDETPSVTKAPSVLEGGNVCVSCEG